jgi:hypothetical protein
MVPIILTNMMVTVAIAMVMLLLMVSIKITSMIALIVPVSLISTVVTVAMATLTVFLIRPISTKKDMLMATLMFIAASVVIVIITITILMVTNTNTSTNTKDKKISQKMRQIKNLNSTSMCIQLDVVIIIKSRNIIVNQLQ